jgi:hypothetical protein
MAANLNWDPTDRDGVWSVKMISYTKMGQNLIRFFDDVVTYIVFQADVLVLHVCSDCCFSSLTTHMYGGMCRASILKVGVLGMGFLFNACELAYVVVS